MPPTTLRTCARLLCLAAAIAACGGDEGVQGPSRQQSAAGRVGVVLPAQGHPVYAQLERALREGLKEHDREVVAESADQDIAKQQELLNRFTSQKARAIVVVPLDSTSLVQAVDAASRAGIPVFTVDMPVPGGRVTTHVEPDHYGSGYAAAEYLGGFLPANALSAILGHASAHGTRELVAGFNAGSSTLKRKVIAGVAPTGGDRARAAEAMTRLLTEDPELDAVFALDPVSALGAMDAAYARRRADIVIVTFGATQEVLDAISAERPIRLAIVPRPGEAARQLAEAIEIQLGDEPVTPAIKVPVRLVTVDSLKAR